MKKLLGIGLALILMVALAAPALAAVTVYTDKADWAAAIGPYETEDFSDATLNPGVSVVSDNGYVTAGGLWWDRMDDGDWGDYGTTTWNFTDPIYAWGGTFDAYYPGGPGSSINVTYMDGTSVFVGTIPNSIAGTFWGFVSDEPFTQVHLEDAALIAYACETYKMDDMVYTFYLPVEVDIKPMSWPNPLNVNGKGVLPVAILGTEDFDVTQIDPATILLEGEAPLRWALEDVGTPGDDFMDGLDGIMDLTLKFDTQEIVAALGPVNDGDYVVLNLTGNLIDGTPISGQDVVRIIKKK